MTLGMTPQHNDIHNDIQGLFVTLSVTQRSVIMLSVFIKSVIMLSVVMLSVIMLSVVMLSVAFFNYGGNKASLVIESERH